MNMFAAQAKAKPGMMSKLGGVQDYDRSSD
jgi:hypothetical protein